MGSGRRKGCIAKGVLTEMPKRIECGGSHVTFRSLIPSHFEERRSDNQMGTAEIDDKFERDWNDETTSTRYMIDANPLAARLDCRLIHLIAAALIGRSVLPHRRSHRSRTSRDAVIPLNYSSEEWSQAQPSNLDGPRTKGGGSQKEEIGV
jgi:hypothetical protein